MKGKGPQIIGLMATELNLTAPAMVWQAQRDESVALACEFGLLVGSLGKIAKDMALLTQFEVAELIDVQAGSAPAQDLAAARMVVLVAAQRVPQRVASMLAGMGQEHERGLSNWQAGLAEWPAMLASTQSATRAIVLLLSGLKVDRQRMRDNLESQRSLLSSRQAAAWYRPELVEHAAGLARAELQLLSEMHKSASGQ
jgi:3-carboxy-cis,cis-muconate cycloisomerase